VVQARTAVDLNRSHADTFERGLSFDRNFFHALWYNRPVQDEKEFTRDFREYSFSSAVFATWAAAVVGTLNTLNREVILSHRPMGLALAQTVFALYWMPPLAFTLGPRLSTRLHQLLIGTYQWLLDAVFAFYFFRVAQRVATIPLDAAGGRTPDVMALLLGEVNVSVVMLILFTTVFLRLPFRHAFVLGVGATVAIDLLAWIRCGFEPSYRLLFTTGLTLALALTAAWRREERERQLFQGKKQAESQSIRADEEKERAKTAAADADFQRKRAEQAAGQAEQMRLEAEAAANRAEELQMQAEFAATVARQQETLASAAADEAGRLRLTAEQAASELQEHLAHRSLMIRALHHDANNTLLNMGADLMQLEDYIAKFTANPCQPQDPISSDTLPRLRRVAEGIRAGNAELNGMMAGMFDLVAAGKYQPRYACVGVKNLLGSLHERFDVPARRKGLDLRVRMPREEVYIWSDSTAIQRILVNLVSNAIKYTRKGGVVVGAVRHRSLLRFDVWDTGIGIPAGKLSEVFREFVRLESDDDTKGLGLGLAIVNHFREKLDGHRLDVNSRQGKGSRFSLTVPVTRPRPQSVTTQVRKGLPVERRYVVVVEDDKAVQDSICSILSSAGYQVEDNVRVASSVGEAAALFDKLPNRAPNVVICDFRLREGENANHVIQLVDERFSWALQPVPILIFSAEISPPAIVGRRNLQIAIKSGDPDVVIKEIELLLESVPLMAIDDD
jgi:signal transduction histidine kinase